MYAEIIKFEYSFDNVFKAISLIKIILIHSKNGSEKFMSTNDSIVNENFLASCCFNKFL